MRIALLADVHGNLPALQAVLDDLQDYQPDLIAVAGDLSGGPFSNEVLHLLNKLGALMILGNSDLGLLRYLRHQGPPAWQADKQFGLLRWNARHLSSDNFRLLAELPEQRVLSLPGVDAIHLVHGSPRDPFESLYLNQEFTSLDLALQMIDEPVLVCGHTHVSWCLQRNGKLAINPGAVAGPLNGETGAQYARLEWLDGGWQVSLKLVCYDLTLVREAFITSGLLEEGGGVARSWLLSMETGRDVTLAFLRFAFQLAEQARYPDCQTLPDEIFTRAEAEFAWDRWCG